jgi:antitoxin ParD1/3/4
MTNHVNLGPEFEAYVQGKVKSGDYSSVSEVLRDGLRLMKERDALQAAKLEQLRDLVRAGLESGSAGMLSAADVKRRGRERLARAKKR